MTQFSDPLYLGAAPTNITSDNNGGIGVGPTTGHYIFDVVPAAVSAVSIAAAQTTAGAANLTLAAAGTGGTTSVTRSDGTTVLQLDTPRTISLTSAGNVSAQTFLVSGFDVYGQPMSELITGPNATTVNGKKAFYQVASIVTSAAVATATSAGTSNILGLPFLVTTVGYVGSVSWNSALGDDTGTFVAPDTTSPATTTTGDVRGTYLPSTATDGTKRLVLQILFAKNQIDQNATRALALGVTQA